MVEKNINWYLSDPERLRETIPFKRGVVDVNYGTFNETVDINETVKATIPTSKSISISQDVYIDEYDPSRHSIHKNKSIPTIAVKIGDVSVKLERIVKASSLQKNIHALHVLHLAGNPTQFTLCNNNDDLLSDIFSEFKQEYSYRNIDKYRNKCVSRQKSTGDSGLLFYMKNKKLKCKCLSYKDGHKLIENMDSDGDVIARTVYYSDGTNDVMDTYTDSHKYRHIMVDAEDGQEWVLDGKPIVHGFSRIPLIYQRGSVAWEYGQSSIEMYEIIDNLLAVVQKRFGQFAIWIKGDVDEDTFNSDGSTLIINSKNKDGNDDMKVLEFPDPKGMQAYLDGILRDIQRSCSVTFIDPSLIKLSGDPSGTAIMMTMKNDIALATQTAADWVDFLDDMSFLFAEGLDLERGLSEKTMGYFSQLKIKASFKIWTPESKSSAIQNLMSQKQLGAISQLTAIENAPDAAPDEKNRIKKENEELKKNRR